MSTSVDLCHMSSKPRTGRRPGPSSTRDEILRAARRRFADDGYDRATFRRIAADAGVDPALVVQFFGSKAKFPAGPAALAVDTGAALLAATLYYEDGHNHVRFHPRIVMPTEGERSRRIFRTTQLVADAFQDGIAARPADWHMLQRVWVEDLDPAKAPRP